MNWSFLNNKLTGKKLNNKLSLLKHVCFLSEESCVQLRMEIQCNSDTKVSHQNLDMAVKFGVEKVDATDINKYIEAFLKKLLLQREKVDAKLMENYLNPKIEKLWGGGSTL